MKVLLIDDMRTEEMLKNDGIMVMPTHIVRTYREAIEALDSGGPWDLVYLDHDLGEEEMTKTGYEIMKFLEGKAHYEGVDTLPGQIHIVSSNPVGRRNMQIVIDRLYN